MSATQPILCPKCGRADAVRKVSAIVAQGTRMGETTGIGLGLEDRSPDLMTFVGSSTSRSVLAARLAPPAKPPKRLDYSWTAVLTFGRLVLVLFSGLLLVGVTLLSFPLLTNTYSANRILLLVPFAMIAVFIVAALLWIVRSVIRDVRFTRNEQDRREARLLTWKRATEQWQSLYYCDRDDEVFLPSENVLIVSQ